MSRHYELLYNMGIQMLHCGKPVAAFDCLVEAVQVFRTNPRLWLRLAECCIMTNREVSHIQVHCKPLITIMYCEHDNVTFFVI